MYIDNKILGAITNKNREREHVTTTGKFYSVYRGLVENIADPFILGRVQVRVPSVHGLSNGPSGAVSEDNKFIPTEHLPWADVMCVGGGSFDRGSSIPMSSGSLVLVVFEGGSPQAPIVIGTFHFFPNSQVPLNTDPYDELPRYKKVPMGLGCRHHAEPTTPTEACLSYRQNQTRFVIHKSLKGHTIWGEDRDDAECFEIVDRNGQGLRMEGFVSLDANKENQARRKTRSAFAHCAVPESKVSRVLLKEVGNNSITLESYHGEKRTRLGSGKVRVEVDGIRQRVLIGNETGIQRIEIDAETNTIRIKSPTITLDCHDMVVSGHTRFLNKVEVLDNLYSYRRFIVNEMNDNTPRVVTAAKGTDNSSSGEGESATESNSQGEIDKPTVPVEFLDGTGNTDGRTINSDGSYDA